MPNAWFRFYHEWDSDPKVQSMSEVMQRRLAMLFCSRCRNETLQETDRAFHWRITPQELAETKTVFMAKGFIDADWNLINWNRRQFLSDSSTERVRRHRQGLKHNGTLHGTKGNVTVTPSSVSVSVSESVSEGISPCDVARGLADRLSLSLGYGPTSFNTAVTEVAQAEQKQGKNLEVLADEMEAAYRIYEQKKPELRIHWGPAKFFGEGHWRNPGNWPLTKEATKNDDWHPGRFEDES